MREVAYARAVFYTSGTKINTGGWLRDMDMRLTMRTSYFVIQCFKCIIQTLFVTSNSNSTQRPQVYN